ncbi:MTAP family purine nucleoside phosphorylase [Nakamurella sp. A5-74]|uniref:Purine nucleoside phosphorylase n=1 Tax=Nakamurella sp. A5-74 TaxID=3158264 RepID=A0AAU8DMA8_9ACTN
MIDDRRPRMAVIGGSGVYALLAEQSAREVEVPTPFGPPSGPITLGVLDGRPIAFLARHGTGHSLPPGAINYRANIWALAKLGVRAVIGSAAVGSLNSGIAPDAFAVPDQLVDHTKHRRDSFFDGTLPDAGVSHLPAADPYCPVLVALAVDTVRGLGEQVHSPCTTAVIEGPRFATRAESRWLRSTGADLVNMSQYPEAVLAAELNIGLVSLAFVTDRDTEDSADGVEASVVFERMRRAEPRIRAALLAVAVAIDDNYVPRMLTDPDAVDRVLAALPTGRAG